MAHLLLDLYGRIDHQMDLARHKHHKGFWIMCSLLQVNPVLEVTHLDCNHPLPMAIWVERLWTTRMLQATSSSSGRR